MRGLGYRAATVGIYLAIADGMGILGPFLFGRLTDRSGKYKGYIVFAYLLTAVVALPLVLLVHPVISALLVAVLAIGYKSAIPLTEAITTINLGEKGNYGKIRVSGSISFVFFMLFLHWAPVLPPNTPINIALWMCITTVLAVVVVIVIPSKITTRRSPQMPHAETSAGGPLRTAPENTGIAKKPIWTPVLIVGLVSIALNRLAMTPAYTFFPIFLVEDMHWNAVGLTLALGAIAEIPFMYFSDRFIRRFGAMPILAFTSLMVAVRLGVYALFPFKPGILVAQLLNCFTYGLFHPAAIAFITDSVPPEKRSFGMGLYLSVGCGIPALLANSIGGFIVDHAGYRALFGLFTIPAVLGAAVYVVFRLAEASTMRRKSA